VIVVLAFDIAGGDEHLKDVLEDLLDAGKFPFLSINVGVRRTRLYKTHFTERNTIPQKREQVPKYLALLELDNEENMSKYELAKKSFSAEMAVFRLLQGFGAINSVYYE
jgi:hypothetical protein